MTGFEVYKMYLALKQHFTKEKYNYHKYRGKVRASEDAFEQRHDRYFFKKLATKYSNQELVDYFVANFAVDGNKWVGNLINNEGTENYTRYKRYKDAFEYHFRNDCVSILNDFGNRGISFDDGFFVHSGQHPRVLRLHIQRKIHIQTTIILDTILSFSKVWDKEINEKVVWPKISLTLAKLKPFVLYNQTQAKLIMKDIFV